MNIKKHITLAILCLIISSCSKDFKRSIGMEREAPDEYQVLKRPPLSVPPKFDLVPPEEEQGSRQQSKQLQAQDESKVSDKETSTNEQKVSFKENSAEASDEFPKKGNEDIAKSKTNTSLTTADKKFMNKSGKAYKKSDIKKAVVKTGKKNKVKAKKKKQ